MKDKIYYYDHNGVLKLTLNQWPYYSEPSDLKDWTWGYNEQFGRINTFHRDKKEYRLVIGISGGAGDKAHDVLCDIFTADVLAERPGRLVLRDWSLECYITASQYAYGLSKDRQAEFTVRATDSTWTRETIRELNGDSGGTEPDGRWRDYITKRGYKPSDKKYGYNMANEGKAVFDLAGLSGNGYKAVIYGMVENPTFFLNNHEVKVNVTVPDGYRLEIISNGPVKTVTLISPVGARQNVFNLRDKDSTPFIDIGGILEVSFGTLNMEFTTIERRSEPTWTSST